MNRRPVIAFALLALFIFANTCSSLAQDPDDLQQGIKAYGTYRGGDIDTVSMTNGNLLVDIPLFSYPQRGKVQVGRKLVYNAKNYQQKTTCLADMCTTYVTRRSVGSPLKVVDEQQFGVTETTVPFEGTSLEVTWYSIVEGNGASHILAAQSTTDSETVDGTGLQSGTSFTAADANGTRFSSTTQEDTNGNQIIGGVDTVGRTIGDGSGSSGSGNCPTGPLTVDTNSVWNLPGPNGGTSTFLLCWAEVTVVKRYDVTDDTQTTGPVDFLQSVVLPNGTAWTFQYSNDNNGDLTKITFPTGGTISYVWEDGSSCSGMLIPPRWLKTRTVNANDGAGDHLWTYTYGPGGLPNTTVTDPLMNNTVYTNTYESDCSAYTTNVQYYQGAVQTANLLKSVSTTYQRTASPFSQYGSGFMNILPNQITTTWYSNGQAIRTSQTTKSYDSGFTFPSPRPNDNTQYTGLYGKVIEQLDYDYGAGLSAGGLLRQTTTSYAWQSPNPHYSNYLSNNMLNLVYSINVLGNQTAYTQYGYDETARVPATGIGAAQNLDLNPWTTPYYGNLTSVNRWLNLPSPTTITSTTKNYNTGMPSVATDPLSNQTTYFYSGTFQGAYVTQVQNALNQSTYFNYDYNTGLKTSTTDPNGQITSDIYDIDWRLTNVTRPTGGGATSFCYTDLGGTCTQGGPPYQVVINKQITSTKNETATAIVDGLGRLAHTQLNSDQAGIDYVDNTYDGVGNKATSTNPYRTTSDSTYGITTNTYDALHRVTQVSQPDGSLLKTAYCANTTLVTDEAGHWRRSTVDGLGRLTEVDEPNSPTAVVNSSGCPAGSDPIWVTTYGYDTLGNLLSVVQAGSRQRNFAYDSLSRILSSTNPESNTVPQTNGTTVASTYTYDADGNVTYKTSPAQNQLSTATVTLSYCYDALNRTTAKGYGQQSCTQQHTLPTPVATYSYDASACLGLSSCSNVGHRTGMTDPAGSESWAYDATGRTGVQSRTTNSKTKTTKYTYNLDSSVATLTYPSARVVTYTPDTAGRPSNVQDNTTSAYYATGTCANGISGNGVCYTPQGAVALLQNGTSLVSTHIYNDRLQPCWMYSTTGTALGTSHLCTDTATAGNMLDLKYNFNLGADNGNPISITNNLVSDRTQTFSYDQLNRVATAQTTATHSSDPGVCWGQVFAYDSAGNWSNLLSIGGVSSAYTGCTQSSLTVGVDAYNRVLSPVVYDTAGNVTNDGSHPYTYDSENRITTAGGATYIYDGDGNRVEKSGSKIYWFAGSEILDETDKTGSVTNSSFNEYFFFGGSRTARRDSSGNVFYYLTDQLGTSRKILQAGQTTACYDADFEPFGGEHAYVNTCPQSYKFTGKERDSESNLDYFGARHYASSMGRYMTPDWAAKATAVPYASFGDPQTLNLYGYVRNNPLSKFDDDGHATIDIRYTSIGPGYTHSYIVVTDTNGARTYFRAGPSAGGPSSGSSGALSSASGGSSSQSSGSGSSGSNSSNSSSPGSGPGGAGADTGPFGALHADSGSYVPGTIDYETNPAASSTLLSNDLPAAGYINQLQGYSDAVNQANIPYNPLSTNSNAFAAGAANSLGLTVPKPSVWAPGAGTTLPVTPPPPAPPPPPPPPCSVAGACSK